MIEAMKQALDALKKAKDDADNYLVTSQQDVRIMGHIVSLIEAELAKPEQEPVAWMLPEYGDVLSASEADGTGIYNIPLYTAPPKREWVGLTELEIKHYNSRLSGSGVAQEIESKLRERNT